MEAPARKQIWGGIWGAYGVIPQHSTSDCFSTYLFQLLSKNLLLSTSELFSSAFRLFFTTFHRVDGAVENQLKKVE